MFFHYVDLEYEVITHLGLIGPNRPNDLFYRSFTQVRGKLSLFFHYIDLECEIITHLGLIGSNSHNDLFYRSFTQVRDKLSLFFHYFDLECELITHWALLHPMTSFIGHSPNYEVNYYCSFTTSTLNARLSFIGPY